MDIHFSNIRNSVQNFNFKESTVGKFVNENKKTIQLVALSALSVGTAYVAYCKLTTPITAEKPGHEPLKKDQSQLEISAKELNKEEYNPTGAIVSYNKPTVSITAENACHELLKNDLSQFMISATGLTKEEYELTRATLDPEALNEIIKTTKPNVYLTCVAKLTHKVTNPSLKSIFENIYDVVLTSLHTKNEAILAEKEFQAKIHFVKI